MRRAITILAISMVAWGCGGGTSSPSVGGGSSAPPAGASAPADASASAPPVAEASPTPNTGLCAAKTPEEATFTFWTFVDRHATWWQKRADEWNTANPDKKITLNCSVIAYQQMHDNLAAAFTAGSGAPNIVDIEIGRFANFTKGTIHLADMTAEVAPYLPDLVATRMAPYSAGGKNYAADYHLGAVLAYYNKEILDAAGVDPATIKTWDDYIAAGKKVQTAKPDVAFAAVDINGVIPIRSLMLQAGGGVYDQSGALIMNSAANVTALQLANKMVNEDKIAIPAPGGNNGQPDFFAAMQAGKVASVWMPQWYMTRFPDNMDSLCGKMVIEPMPTFPDGKFTTTMQGGTGTAVTDQTPAEKIQLAKDFVTWAKLTKEGQTSIWTDLGFDPYRPDVYDDPSLRKPDPCFSNQITFDVIKSELGNVAPEYTGPAYPQAQDYLANTLINDVLVNKLDPKEALDTAQQTIESQQ
jgi:arabinosaccharide transport system substrate-binding protein